MIQSDKYKKIWMGEKEHWGERFNSSEEVGAGFIEVVIVGWTLENECFQMGMTPGIRGRK